MRRRFEKVGRPLSRDQNRRSITAFGICCLTSGYSSSSKNPTFGRRLNVVQKGWFTFFLSVYYQRLAALDAHSDALRIFFFLDCNQETKPSRRCLFSFENELFLWVRQRLAGTLQTLVDVSKDGGIS